MMKGTVLVVDDDQPIAELVDLALRERGYRVMMSSGGDSLSVARHLQPDIILLDVTMPEMDGVEVSRRLRSDPATARIPIVVMSALPRIEYEATNMRYDDRLLKPFTLARLLATVERWVRVVPHVAAVGEMG